MQKTFSSNSTILVSFILVFEMKKLFWGKIDIAPKGFPFYGVTLTYADSAHF